MPTYVDGSHMTHGYSACAFAGSAVHDVYSDSGSVFRFNEHLLRQQVNQCIDARLDEIMEKFRDVVRESAETGLVESDFMRILNEVGGGCHE